MHNPLIPLTLIIRHVKHQMFIQHQELAQPYQQVIILLTQFIRLAQKLNQLQLRYPPPLIYLLLYYAAYHANCGQILQCLMIVDDKLLDKLQFLVCIL